MTFLDLLEKTKGDYKKYRAIYTLITTQQFKNLFQSASLESAEKVIGYIEKSDIKSINNWVIWESGQFPPMLIRQLAKRCGVKNYGRQTTHRLFIEMSMMLGEKGIKEQLIK